MPAHKIKVPREDLEVQLIPSLIKNFIYFAIRNSFRNIQLLDEINAGAMESSMVSALTGDKDRSLSGDASKQRENFV